MRLLAAIALSLSLLASTFVPSAPAQDAQGIKITRRGSQASRQGPAENFTGSVRVDPLFEMHPPGRASGSLVTFEPGARTGWHTHPLAKS